MKLPNGFHRCRSSQWGSFVIRLGGESKRRWLALALLSLGLLALIGAGVTIAGWHVRAWRHYQAALEAVEKHDLVAVRDHLAVCLGVWPSSGEMHLLAARTARQAGAYDEAENHLKECLRLGWPAEEISLERDLIGVQRGELGSGETRLLQLVEQGHPDALLILEALCHGYIQSYRLPEASRCLELWLERRPNDIQALLWRAEVEELRFSAQDALADYRRVVERTPERDAARLRLAELLLAEHQPREAAPHFESLLQRQPANPAVLLGLARCRHLLGDTAEASALLDGLLSSFPYDVGGLGERGKIYLEARQPAEAERWLRLAASLAPYDRDIIYPFYLCLQQCGKAEEAEGYRVKLKEIQEQLARLAELTRRIADKPHDPLLRYQAGLIFMKSGQTKEGLRWLYSALQEEPHHRPTHQALADYYEGIGDRGQAARHRRQ